MKREKLPGTMQLAYYRVKRVQWTKMKREKLPGTMLLVHLFLVGRVFMNQN